MGQSRHASYQNEDEEKSTWLCGTTIQLLDHVHFYINFNYYFFENDFNYYYLEFLAYHIIVDNAKGQLQPSWSDICLGNCKVPS